MTSTTTAPTAARLLTTTPLIRILDLKVHFPVERGLLIKRRLGTIKAVDGVSLDINSGEVLGLVGESGCGKSTLARGILRLVPITEGEVLFEGNDLAGMRKARLNQLRPSLQMIFQDPYASLNPRKTVFDTIAEPLKVHGLSGRKNLALEVGRLMGQVGLAPRLMRKYPHEFSGGQRQRIAIARALALNPRLLIADEPVSALDVSVQAQILNLLRKLQREHNLTMLFVSHDLAVVRHMTQRIAVMYFGRIVEIGAAETIFERPAHPYTRTLLEAIPVPDPVRARIIRDRLPTGDPPSPLNPPPGCAFAPRCPYVKPACRETVPELTSVFESGSAPHHAACLLHDSLPPFSITG